MPRIETKKSCANCISTSIAISMARGKPCPEQIDLSMPMFDLIDSKSDLVINGADYRNYGVLDGIPEMWPFKYKTMSHD